MRGISFKHLVFLLLIMLLSQVAVVAQEARTAWSAPQILGDGWWQSVTTDRQGTAHIGWYGVVNGSDDTQIADDFDALMYIERASDGTWTPANDVIVTGTGGYTIRNALAATSDGMLHAVFRAGTAHQFSHALITSATNASSWSTPRSVSSTGYYVDMIADANSVLHIVYSGREMDIGNQPFSLEGDPCPLCSDLYYRRSLDEGATWTQPLNLSRDKDAGSDRPGIWVGASGRLYVMWDIGKDWYIGRGTPSGVGLRYSDDEGITWSDTIVLQGSDDPELRATQIAAAELRDGTLMAVWRYANNDDRQIYYQLSSDIGKTWTDPEPIAGIYARPTQESDLDDYEMVTDPLGVVHLFVVGQPELASSANATLYHIEYRQGRWAAKQRIFYSTEEQPEWPKAAVGPSGEIHLTWFVRLRPEGITSFRSSTEGLRVYYSYRGPILSSQPTQAFDPTRTPVPTPTLIQELVPTATSLPTVAPIENPVVRSTRDTYAIQTVFLSVVVVALLCGGVIAVTRFWRR